MNATKKNIEIAISARILALIKSGKTVREAWAIVLPAVPFEKFAADLYDALRAN